MHPKNKASQSLLLQKLNKKNIRCLFKGKNSQFVFIAFFTKTF